jgi:H+/Cl- antiporter ClcA
VAAGKVALTLFGLCCGASIGREGPTVQVGAAIMHTLGRLLRLPRLDLERALVLAGGGAGVAAALQASVALHSRYQGSPSDAKIRQTV